MKESRSSWNNVTPNRHRADLRRPASSPPAIQSQPSPGPPPRPRRVNSTASDGAPATIAWRPSAIAHSHSLLAVLVLHLSYTTLHTSRPAFDSTDPPNSQIITSSLPAQKLPSLAGLSYLLKPTPTLPFTTSHRLEPLRTKWAICAASSRPTTLRPPAAPSPAHPPNPPPRAHRSLRNLRLKDPGGRSAAPRLGLWMEIQGVRLLELLRYAELSSMRLGKMARVERLLWRLRQG